MKYKSLQNRPDYFPPILGNGDIAFGVTAEGAFDYKCRGSYGDVAGFDGCIVRAGRRLAVTHDRGMGRILSFGSLSVSAGDMPFEWEQELIPEDGVIQSVCRYADAEIKTECFVYQRGCIYAMRKTALSGDAKLSYTYALKGYDRDTDEVILGRKASEIKNGGDIDFKIFGTDILTGKIRVMLDRECEVSLSERSVSLTCELKKDESVSFFLILEDNLGGTDFESVINNEASDIECKGFDGLLRENKDIWNEYFAEGYINTGEKLLDSAYKTALYHLKCYTTKWSIPVGLNNAAWDGKFFAFDEYYSFLGLLGANRCELASRVPNFRLRVCLDKAIKRANQFGEEMARFCWETSEYGEELAIPGHWHDHFFHMAVVAIGAFEYYEHSGDVEFLGECYRMIRACAMFYTRFLIYHDHDGRVYIGKCTDLERLGEAIENPFMTSCGVIKTLEVLVKAADILGTDKEYRNECALLAKALRESLPEEDGRFVPYVGSPHKSIGVFAGKYPFDVMASDDERLFSAWEDFIANESEYGNMYRTGNKVSPWYAAWKSVAYARTLKGDKAYANLLQALASVGCFSEMYEINEPARRPNPWFTTAAGVFMCAINEMLLQSDGENIYLLPAFPEETEVSFKLSAKGGAVVDASIAKDGKLDLRLSMKKGNTPKVFRVFLRGEFIGEVRAE